MRALSARVGTCFAVVLGMAVLPVTPTSAATVPAPPAASGTAGTPPPTTSDLADLHLVGSAIRRGNGWVRLVDRRASTGLVGGAHIGEPVQISTFDLVTTFRMRRGCTDGIAVVVQNDGPDALGGSGGSMGYGRGDAPGITHSLAIELDTYQSDEPPVPHVSLQTRGVRQNDNRPAYSLASVPTSPVMDGAWHQFSVTYSDGTLRVGYDGEPLVDHAVDLVALLGLDDETAYVGVVAANGGCRATTVLSEFELTL